MLAAAPNIMQGPYRATKLWNEAVRLFRTGMPVKKHRYVLKVYNDTFTGTEAVDWLHALLKANPNFGPHVTQDQTFQLLKKFLQNHVIEDVNGRWGSDNFSDGNQLYRFPTSFSPSKIIKQPLALLSDNQSRCNHQQTTKDRKISPTVTFQKKPQRRNVSPVLNLLSKDDKTLDVWNQCLVSRLLHTLHYDSKDKLFAYVPGKYIESNVTSITDLSEGHEMPFWVLSAMKCLASWPNSDDPDLPCYPGFERDVFSAVCGYFQSLGEPLLTYKLYKLFISVYGRGDMLDQVCSNADHYTKMSDAALHAEIETKNKVDKQRVAVERIERQLHQARLRHANRAVRRTRSGRSRKLEFMHGHTNSTLHGCSGAYKSLPRRPDNIANTLGYDLNETATRETWLERFHSMHALDVLSEEQQRFDNLQDQQCNSSSLPDLLDCDSRGPMLSGIRECSRTPGDLDDEIVAGAGYEPRTSLHDDHREMCTSVENLLLNMSNDMRDEMVEDLMASPSPQNDNVYESIKTLSRNEKSSSSVSSPLYRTMKACNEPEPIKQKVESPYMLMMKQTAVARHAAIRRSQTSLNHVHEDVVAKRRSLCVPEKENLPSYHDQYLSLPRRQRSNYASVVKPKRTTLKPSHDDLEHQLMQSIAESGRGNYSCLDGGVLDMRSRPTLATIPSSSNIVARREVPPDCPPQSDPHKVKTRIMRLPYVSNEMSMANLHSSNTSNKHDQRFTRLCRSHSSLSHRKPRMNELRLSSRHGSMHVLNTRCSQRDYQDPIAIEKRLKSYPVKFEPQVNPDVDMKPINEPQSPLSAAFITAKKKLSQDAAHRQAHICESLQLCLVLLPPQNRSRISLLLRLMKKIASNPHLVELHDQMSTKNLLLERFTPCFLSPEDGNPSEEEKQTAASIVEVMMDNSSTILQPPKTLKEDALKKEKEIKPKSKSRKLKPLQRQMTFCNQVPQNAAQKKAYLQDSLTELLFGIINNRNLGPKEKKKKLKQFAKCYPDIYYAHFPTEEAKVTPQPRKRNALSNAMQKLRGLRM